MLRVAARWALAVAAAAVMTGCGGPDFTAGSRTNSFDTGYGGGSYGGGYGGPGGGYGGANAAGGRQSTTDRTRGTYPMVEVSFDLPSVKGNPFNFEENDVVMEITQPDGSRFKAPAFFDGGTTWRVRFTPSMPGRHMAASITLNNGPVSVEKLERREFEVSGKAEPGFVRRDPRDKSRFALDDGGVYYPIGCNIAWGAVAPALEKLGAAGGNWARVWMCHWSGMNLDWVAGKKVAPGAIDLDVARKWDEVVSAAGKAGVRFQMVLQHHGQYSTRTNPNWAENPWNTANGGFLGTPGEFFSNSRSRAATRAKYRYIVARYGYSPNIMAWELFNEVEWTDAVTNKHMDEVASWHDEMAGFLRRQDPYRHLITTSSGMELAGLWKSMDYLQPHSYPPDPLPVVASVDEMKLDRPIFYGEIGPGDGSSGAWEEFAHRSIWGAIASGSAGAAQVWSWDDVEKKSFYSRIGAAAAFVRQSGLTTHRALVRAAATVETAALGPLSISPGMGWGGSRRTEFTVPATGMMEGLGQWPSSLHGDAHRAMFPGVSFKVRFPRDGKALVRVGPVARAGAALVIQVDGKEAARRAFPAADHDVDAKATVEAAVPAGEHVVRLENPGADWLTVARVTLDPYSPALSARGRSTGTFAALWVQRSGAPSGDDAISGKVKLSGMQAGEYRVNWWDTQTGKSVNETTARCDGRQPLELTTPPISRDLAVFLERGTAAAGASGVRSRDDRPVRRAGRGGRMGAQ